MNNVPFTLSQVRPIRDAMTVSRPSGLGYEVPVTWFSLGAGTSITPESYDCTTLYLGGEGNGKFLLGVDGQEVSVKPGEVLYVPPKTLCGTKTDSGMIYTEIILKKENFTMNNILKAGQPTELKDLISYEDGSIANLDLVHADNMKFVLMAFDEGTGLTPAPRTRQCHPDRTGGQGHHRLRGPGLRADRRRVKRTNLQYASLHFKSEQKSDALC